MRRHRNPRYAPESLERRLSPTVTVPAIVTTLPAYCPILPGDMAPPKDPPPPVPTGPTGPAIHRAA